eukprot:scaffold330_cov246-Pinguiococcus_pyrenoidosus.AAC.9
MPRPMATGHPAKSPATPFCCRSRRSSASATPAPDRVESFDAPSGPGLYGIQGQGDDPVARPCEPSSEDCLPDGRNQRRSVAPRKRGEDLLALEVEEKVRAHPYRSQATLNEWEAVRVENPRARWRAGPSQGGKKEAVKQPVSRTDPIPYNRSGQAFPERQKPVALEHILHDGERTREASLHVGHQVVAHQFNGGHHHGVHRAADCATQRSFQGRQGRLPSAPLPQQQKFPHVRIGGEDDAFVHRLGQQRPLEASVEGPPALLSPRLANAVPGAFVLAFETGLHSRAHRIHRMTH